MKGCDYSLTLIFAYAEVIAGDMSDKVRVIRFDALKRLQAILAFYKDRGYMEELLDGIAEKKCQMIMSVTSKTEMEKVLKPHCPHYDGVKFIPDTYNVPEEELICWSETSFLAPIKEAGYNQDWVGYLEFNKKHRPHVLQDDGKGVSRCECESEISVSAEESCRNRQTADVYPQVSNEDA